MTTTPENQDLRAIAEPVCAAHGVELVLIERQRQPGGTVVRVFIDRARSDGRDDASGVSVEDCQMVSRDLSEALDVHEELLPAKYRLEVSSPGLERPLVRMDDFDRFRGREVRVRTREPVAGRRKFQGELLGVEGGHVRVSQDGTPVSIAYEAITKANLVYRF